MVLNKWTGACGMLEGLYTFQAFTKMPGGDEFLVRFLDAESARLGLTPSSFVETCKGAGKHYAEMEKLATAKPASAPTVAPSSGKFILLDDEPSATTPARRTP